MTTQPPPACLTYLGPATAVTVHGTKHDGDLWQTITGRLQLHSPGAPPLILDWLPLAAVVVHDQPAHTEPPLVTTLTRGRRRRVRATVRPAPTSTTRRAACAPHLIAQHVPAIEQPEASAQAEFCFGAAELS